MTTKPGLKAMLSKVLALTRASELDSAQALLAQIAADPDRDLLGQRTVLGLPRQIHAAWLRLAKARGDAVRRIGYQYTLVPPPERLARFGRFSTAERLSIAGADRIPVPPVLHQIWIGPKPPPVTTDAWRSHCAAHGFDYRLWREDDLRTAGISGDAVFAAMLDRRDYPGAVDVARYHILHRHGGLYLDCDWYPARQDVGFADRLSLVGLSALAEPIPRETGRGSLLLSNACVAVPAGHPVMRRIIEVLPQILAEMADVPAWWSTGPLLFTVVARAGTVGVIDAGLVAGQAEPTATMPQIEELCAEALRSDGGLLLAWKPW